MDIFWKHSHLTRLFPCCNVDMFCCFHCLYRWSLLGICDCFDRDQPCVFWNMLLRCLLHCQELFGLIFREIGFHLCDNYFHLRDVLEHELALDDQTLLLLWLVVDDHILLIVLQVVSAQIHLQDCRLDPWSHKSTEFFHLFSDLRAFGDHVCTWPCVHHYR